MRIDRDPRAPGPIVSGLGPGGFRVDDRFYRALLLRADEAYNWTPPPLNALSVEALAPLLDPRPEFVLLGTGPDINHPPAALRMAIEAREIGLEVMDSRAAARAWGVLRNEGRRIAAALYPIG
jgi:uncharacterized protein